MHGQMLSKLSRTFISFFDETPIGTILNRFSNDIGSLDKGNWILFFDILEASASYILFAGISMLPELYNYYSINNYHLLSV